jgi:hypothetical protein
MLLHAQSSMRGDHVSAMPLTDGAGLREKLPYDLLSDLQAEREQCQRTALSIGAAPQHGAAMISRAPHEPGGQGCRHSKWLPGSYRERAGRSGWLPPRRRCGLLPSQTWLLRPLPLRPCSGSERQLLGSH